MSWSSDSFSNVFAKRGLFRSSSVIFAGSHAYSQAPIEVAPIDSVTVAREYAWDPANMTEEERNNPLLAETLEKLSEDHDIIVEVIEE